MTKGGRQRHLVRRPGAASACGIKHPTLFSTDPAQVDCANCARTLAMADAEFAKGKRSFRPKRRGKA